MKNQDKKAEMTSQQIVTIIILIVSFIIILIFFFSLNLKSEVNKESCRNSVVLRGTELGKSASLQCRTEEVCVSGGSDCQNLGKDAITLKAQNKEELFNQLSNMLYDCWYQMGEGKVDYAPRGLGFSENYCAICNIVKFDEQIKDNPELRSIKTGDFYRYLQARKVPNGDKSYLYYLYGVNSLDAVRDKILNSKDLNMQVDIYNQNIDLTNPKGYSIITGIVKQGRGIELISLGVGVVAGVSIAVMATPAAGVAAAASVQKAFSLLGFTASAKTGAVAGGLAGFALTSGGKTFTPPNLYPYDGETIQKLDCKEFTSLA